MKVHAYRNKWFHHIDRVEDYRFPKQILKYRSSRKKTLTSMSTFQEYRNQNRPLLSGLTLWQNMKLMIYLIL
jgi:hypothetical protein